MVAGLAVGKMRALRVWQLGVGVQEQRGEAYVGGHESRRCGGGGGGDPVAE